ncbi:MAG: hypothetical protein JSW37_13350, partial [Anaerolineales bacterium]
MLNLSGLLSPIREASGYRHILKMLQSPGSSPSAFTLAWGLLKAARAPVLAALQTDWQGPILVLTNQPERARSLQEEVALWSDQSRRALAEAGSSDSTGQLNRAAVWYFPAPDALFYDRTPWDGETIRRRVTVLSALADNDFVHPPLIFTSTWAVMTPTVPRSLLRPGIRTLRVGQTVRLSRLLEELVAYAYEPVSVVEEPGTFSQRGGILDIFPSDAAQPVR